MEGGGGNDNKYRRAIKHIKKNSSLFPMSCQRNKNLRLSTLFIYLGWGNRCGRRKKEVFFTIYTRNHLLLEQSSTNLKGTKGDKKSSFTNLAEMCPRGFRQYTNNPLHMNVLKIPCTLQKAWLYYICPEECLCKILYLAL